MSLGAARSGEYMAIKELHFSATRGQGHHVSPRGGAEVHVNVCAAAARIQVVAGIAAVFAYRTA